MWFHCDLFIYLFLFMSLKYQSEEKEAWFSLWESRCGTYRNAPVVRGQLSYSLAVCHVTFLWEKQWYQATRYRHMFATMSFIISCHFTFKLSFLNSVLSTLLNFSLISSVTHQLFSHTCSSLSLSPNQILWTSSFLQLLFLLDWHGLHLHLRLNRHFQISAHHDHLEHLVGSGSQSL